MSNFKIGTLIRATSHDGRVIIAGRYVSDGFDVSHNPVMVIEQPNGVYGYVSNQYFLIEEVRPKRTKLDLEIEEVVAQFLKDGYTKEFIIETFKTAYENMRDPVKEIKGEMDT